MEKINEFLANWTENYIKNKDLILRRIEKLNNLKEKLEVKYKDRTQTYFIEPFLEEAVFKKISKKHITIACLNTRENIEFIFRNWQKLVDFPQLSVFFINPFSKTEKIWILYPATHHRIADESSLKQGLLSLSEQVELTSKKEVETILLSS